MTSPFSINNLLFPLTKGDTPGHAFHGNQYQTGQSGGESLGSLPSGVHTINGKDLTIAPNADLTLARMMNANLVRADLNNADLFSASLNGADLRGANLKDASLMYADLRGANLEGADLRGATLYMTHFGNANLDGADLRGVNMRDAFIEGSTFEGAKINTRTKFPDTNEFVNEPGVIT